VDSRRILEPERFGWQDGYGIFSVSKSQVPNVIRYIENQREHHCRETFEEEYISLLKLHGIEYDPKYVSIDFNYR
jgi:hypothetical protein